MSIKEIRLLAATGLVGYGFTEDAFDRALHQGIDVIAADGGSMDPGPYYLGAGKPFVSPEAIERDLRLMLIGARSRNIPLIIGSAGGGGGRPHVALTRSIIEKIARVEGLSMRLAVIDAEPSRDLILERLRTGRIKPLWPLPDLTPAAVQGSTRIVAMMGAEPLQAALSSGANVILAGRCSDSALYAAVPLMKGYDPGLAWHMGKTMECGAAIVRPKTGQDCVIGSLREDHFLIEPAHPEKRCTPETVASHTMYENPSPYEFIEPSGIVDTRQCTYEAVDNRRVIVKGSRFTHATTYTVKLEGVALAGYRAVCMGGIRDPILVSCIDSFTPQVHERLREETQSLDIPDTSYVLTVRRYGVDGVLGQREPRPSKPYEIGIMLDVVADSPERASAVLAKARYIVMHTDFDGRMCTAGNFAVPFAPSDIPVGPTYRFSVWHAMELDDPLEIFPIEYFDIPGAN